jgi:hypothetical protein
MWPGLICAATRDSDKSERTARFFPICPRGSRYWLAAHEDQMSGRGREPMLDEILSDPIVVALMAADGVDPRELEAMVSRVGRCRSINRRMPGG